MGSEALHGKVQTDSLTRSRSLLDVRYHSISFEPDDSDQRSWPGNTLGGNVAFLSRHVNMCSLHTQTC